MRRRPRWIAIAIILAATIALVGARDSILPKPHEFRATTLRIVAPGVYDTIVGETKTRSLGTPATIRWRPSGQDAMVVEFDANMPVDYVRASWICGDRRCTGTAHADGRKRGSITVRNGVQSWSCLDCLFESSGSVDLIGMTAEGATAIQASLGETVAPPYFFDVPLERTGAELRGAFVLPPGPTEKLKFTSAAPARIDRDGEMVTVTVESPQRTPKSVRVTVEEDKS